MQSGLSRNTAGLWNALETPQLEPMTTAPSSRCLRVTLLSRAHAPSNVTTFQSASGRSSCRLARFRMPMLSCVPFTRMHDRTSVSHSLYIV